MYFQESSLKKIEILYFLLCMCFVYQDALIGFLNSGFHLLDLQIHDPAWFLRGVASGC